MTTFIYALCEPGTRTVRYIGQTKSLKRRLTQHLKQSSKEKTRLGYWLRSLSGLPILVVLHVVAENESWQEEERRYISCARAIGMTLVNLTDGGEGTPGPKSREHRAALSAARKGVPWSPAHRATKMGVPKSPLCRANISAAKKGVPLSPKHCAALRAARNERPWSPERCAHQSAVLKGKPWSSARRAAHEKGRA